jgi:hypothetical protein
LDRPGVSRTPVFKSFYSSGVPTFGNLVFLMINQSLDPLLQTVSSSNEERFDAAYDRSKRKICATQ